MMTPADLAAILESGLSICVIIVLMLRLWPEHRVDEFRQALFVVRDELFDFAASERISFNHPAYKLLRQSMNGFIRYGHQITLFRLVCNLIRWKLHGETLSWSRKWDAALNSIEDREVKDAMVIFQGRMLALVAKRLVTGSPILIALLAGMMATQAVKSQWVSMRQLARDSAQGVMSRLFDLGFLEEEASRA